MQRNNFAEPLTLQEQAGSVFGAVLFKPRSKTAGEMTMMNWKQTAEKPLMLVFPFEQLAHYLRCLTLAQKLRPYFEIRFADSARYRSFIEEAGFQTFPCAGMDADAALDCVKRFDFSWLSYTNLEHAFNAQVAAIEAAQPAVVLGDAVPTLRMATEKANVPYITLQNGYMSPYFAGTRKMSWRYPLYKYFRFLPDAVLDPLTQKGEDLTFRKMHQPFAALRQQHGLLKKQSYAEETQGDLNLICDLPDLFPQRSLPENYLFIPPLQYQPEIETNNVVNKLQPGKRALFASMGSTGDWSALNFLNEPQFRQYNIITAGDSAGVVQGPNVIRMPFVAAEPLFRHIDLVLCHGGNGTVYQALQYGIPLLCKTAHFEQEWNVQALQKNGLGTSLDHVKSGREALKLVDAWSRKRGTMPFLTIQEKLGDAAALWESVLMRIAAFAPAVEKRLLYTPERKTA